MKQNQIICKNCGNACFLEVFTEQNKVISINGNRCDGGKRYAENIFCTAYLETPLPTTDGRMTAVRSTEPIPYAIQQKCLNALSGMVLETPIIKGEMILQDAADCGVDIVATENIF